MFGIEEFTAIINPPESAILAVGAIVDTPVRTGGEPEFRPMPGMFGRFTRLPEEIFFGGVETPEGWTERGETFVAFLSDGSTEFTQIVLEAEDGGSLTLDVRPFADTVRIRDESL